MIKLYCNQVWQEDHSQQQGSFWNINIWTCRAMGACDRIVKGLDFENFKVWIVESTRWKPSGSKKTI